MSPADFQDIEQRLPFVLTKEDVGQYDLTYLGKQKVDELDTYVFDVKPKVIEKNKRYFQCRIWVEQHDLQIVVTNGKNVPDDTRKGHEDLSPPFTTYREQIGDFEIASLQVNFNDITLADAQASMRLFGEEVLPRL